MSLIAVIIPTYGRAERLAEVAENIRTTTTVPHRTYFVIESDDAASRAAVEEIEGVRLIVNQRSRSYAGAANTAYHGTNEPYLFAGSDDLRFHLRWDIEALALMENSVDKFVAVVGTNDRLNPYVRAGSHATHYLVDRMYLNMIGGVVDEGPGSFLAECYSHNFVDTEFIGTAKMRARFRPCLDSIVEHLHHSAGLMRHDATHAKAEVGYAADSALYDERRDLWFEISR